MVKYTIVFVINFTTSDSIVRNVSRITVDKTLNIDDGNHHVFNVKYCEKQYLHINYKTFAEQNNNIYIICAGKVAKIFIDQGSNNTVIKMADLYNNQNWVVFGIEHNDHISNYEHAMKFFNSHASFKFTFNNNNFPSKIKVDKLAMTYTAKIPTQDIHTDNGHVILRAQQFVELNEIISDTRSKKSQIRFNFNGLTLDRQQICEAYDTIYELMNANNDTNNVALKNSSVPTDESETTNITIIHLDGKSLFYDEQFFKAFQNNPSTGCKDIAVIVDTSKFYSTEMKKFVIPFVLRIPRLYLLPIQEFHNLNIQNLYLQSENETNLLFTKEIKIGPIPLDESDVCINYEDVFFIEPQNVAAVAEFLLSESVLFKLTCDPIIESPDAAALYGGSAFDQIVGNRKRFTAHRKYAQILNLYDGRHPHAIRLSADTSQKTIVGHVAFDLSDLVHRSHRVDVVKSFTTRRSTFQKIGALFQTSVQNEYVFKERDLREFGMSVELRINAFKRLDLNLDWNNGPFLRRYANRAVIVCERLYTRDLLKFYKDLIEHNGREILLRFDETSAKSPRNETLHDLFSGYVVDCVEYTIMFVEGLHNTLRTLLGRHFVQHEPIVLYDRMNIFKTILYDAFYKFGGFYHISMSRPLEEFLNDFGPYLEGNVPLAAQKSLLKLDLTRKCKNIREFCNGCLAIEPYELQSLDIEFGLPMQYMID